MSLLSELNAIAESCGVPVETGIFSDPAPDTYLVLTPLSDSFDLHADDRPGIDTQEVRLSLFCRENYMKIKNVPALDVGLVDRRAQRKPARSPKENTTAGAITIRSTTPPVSGTRSRRRRN